MPLRRALAGLALACLALLLAGPAHAQCADTDIWCATMTVGHVDPTTGIDPFNDGAPFVRFDASDEAAGYSAAGVGAGALEPASFTVDGVTYTVEYLYNSYLKPGNFTHATSTGLYIGFSGPLPPALPGFLRLRLGNESLKFSDVWGNHGNQWFWQHTTRRSLHVRYPFRAWPAGEPVVVRLLRRRSWRGVCLRVRGPTAAARSARWPARVVAVEPLLDQASDKLPQRHARVHVREQPPELLQPLLALRVDSRLQLVAAVAERAHPVGRRRQLRVHVGQHLADQVPGLPQEFAVGEGADGGGYRGQGGGGEMCGLHAVNILPVSIYTSSSRPRPALNLRAACAERGAVQPKGPVSFSEAGRDWNVRWRGTSHAQNPVKSPRHDFSTFLAPVRVPQCRRQGSGIRNREPRRGAGRHRLLRGVLLQDTVRFQPLARRFRRPQSLPAGPHVTSFHTHS